MQEHDIENVKVHSVNGTSTARFAEGNCTRDCSFFFRIIENAEGVPFQLIFGPQIGGGHYLYVGKGIEQLFGIPPEDFTEKLYYEMIEEVVPLTNNISSDPSETRRRFRNGEFPAYKAEVLVRTPGGDKKWIRDSAMPVIDSVTGQVIGALGILSDISELKNSQITIRTAVKRADEYDRMKSAFLRNVSHEIRTPLNAIVGFSTLLGESAHSALEQQEYLNIITRNTDHLLRVITDIVEMSKIEADTVKVVKERVNISQMLERVYDHNIEKAHEKGLSLSFKTPPASNDLSIVTDSFKVTQTLDNLIDNALKFTMSGKIVFGFEIKKDKVEFYVSDTGPGIPGDLHDKVFNRFYQAESGASRRFEGIGLGLPIAKAYIEMLGGEIWVHPKSDEGTLIKFSIPL